MSKRWNKRSWIACTLKLSSTFVNGATTTCVKTTIYKKTSVFRSNIFILKKILLHNLKLYKKGKYKKPRWRCSSIQQRAVLSMGKKISFCEKKVRFFDYLVFCCEWEMQQWNIRVFKAGTCPGFRKREAHHHFGVLWPIWRLPKCYLSQCFSNFSLFFRP